LRMDYMAVAQGLLIPFLGTALGASLVFFPHGQVPTRLSKLLVGFAAGAMVYVVVEELIPEMSEGPHSNAGAIAFAIGFVLMMVLDVTLG